MTSAQYPRLLPPPLLVTSSFVDAAPAVHTPLHSLPPGVRTALTNTLESGKKRITKELLALCEYNLNPELPVLLQRKDPIELELLAMNVTIGLRKWCTKRIPSAHHQSGTSVSRKRKRGNSYPTIRSTKSAKNALLRDNSRCVLTNRAEPMVEVAHIFPVAVHPIQAPCLEFMTLLRAFGGEEMAKNVAQYLGLDVVTELMGERVEVRSDMSATSDASPFHSLTSDLSAPVVVPAAQLPINRLENIITLSTEAHKLFGNGVIILEPIGDPLTIFDSNTNPHPHDTTGATSPKLTSYDVVFSYMPSHPTASEWNLTSFCTSAPLFSLQHTEESDPKLAECELIRHPLPNAGETYTTTSTGRALGRISTTTTATDKRTAPRESPRRPQQEYLLQPRGNNYRDPFPLD